MAVYALNALEYAYYVCNALLDFEAHARNLVAKPTTIAIEETKAKRTRTCT